MATANAEQALEKALNDMDERRQRQLESHVLYYAQHPEMINPRLQELDREWDVERAAEAELGVSALLGLTFGLFSRKWTLLGALAAGFLAYHAFQKKSAVGLAYRRFGFRTMNEIDQERFALKALRGDFGDLNAGEANLMDRVRRATSAAY